MFHLDISGSEFIFKQLENKPAILLTFFVFQIEISGKDNKDSQNPNISFIKITLLVFHFDIFRQRW